MFDTILQLVIVLISAATFVLLAIGLWRWLPTLMWLKRSTGEQERTNQELDAQLEQVSLMAHHDFLTGLPNRRSFQDTLENCVARNRRSGEKMALLFIDLDHFKRINDTLGHQAGDQLLQEFSQRLSRQLRREDVLVHDSVDGDERVISRFGGDEFVVILPTLKSPRDAARVARRFLDSLEDPFRLDMNEVYASASIGIATYPDDGADSESLLKSADRAMYHAKDTGRNRFQYYSTEMNEQTMERLKLEAQLRRALSQGELELHFQPQIDVDTLQINAVEALVRWDHPQKGWIPADMIISIAEESGLIINLGEWVLRGACAQARIWHDRGLALRVSVNLSSLQFQVSRLHQLVLDILEESGIPASSIDLELTEASIMQDEERVVAVLQTLRDSGLNISLDNFGSGYTSLGYLRRLPINTVKIDRSMIANLSPDNNEAEILRLIISLVECLDLKVVAEGVETTEQLEAIRRAGCHLVQGYWFSPAVAAVELDAIIAHGDLKVATSSEAPQH